MKQDKRSGAFEQLEERIEKRRRKASLGKLIFYIILLIAVIIAMYWLKK